MSFELVCQLDSLAYISPFFVILIGIGTEKPNNWAFDTTQFDNILKKLKVVISNSTFSHAPVVYNMVLFVVNRFLFNLTASF